MTAPMTDAEIREALARAEREIVGLKAALACCPASTPPCELDTRWQDLVRLWTEERYARCAAERERYAATEAWKSSVDEWRAMSVRAETAEKDLLAARAERDEARAAWKLAVERPTKEELRSALARAETAEARCRELEGFVRGFLHASSGTRDENAAALLSRLETRAQVLLSPPPSHTCQIHRATSGASDCGLEPCEEATVHRDRGEARPAENATPEAAKCATCDGQVLGSPDEQGEPFVPTDRPCPDCGGGA